MDTFITYQQDTTLGQHLLKYKLKKTDLSNTLNTKKIPLPIITDERENIQIEKSNPATKRWKKKRTAEDLKYINPQTEVKLSSSQTVHPNFVLPIRERKTVNTDWLTLIIFVGILIFATVRYAYSKYLSHLFLSLINYATSVRLFQEKGYSIFHGAYRLDLIFYFILSAFIFQILTIFKWNGNYPNFTYFLIILGSVFTYFLVKKFLYFIVGLLFETKNETLEYLFNVDNFNRSLGVILLPIVILVAFMPLSNTSFTAFLGIIIFFIFYLILLQRGIVILLRKQFSIFYLFLYLCTLEFLPLLLIYTKVVK